MKRIITLVVVFIVLLGIYLFSTNYIGPAEFTPPEEFSFSGWQEDSFTEVTIKGIDNTISLKKENEEWFVNSYKADSSRVSLFLSTIASMRAASRASTNPENHDRFQVGDGASILTISFVDGHQETFVLGKSAGGNSMYMRLPEEDDVYVINRVAASLFTTDILGWRIRQITSIPDQDIESITFVNRLDNYTVSKELEEYFIQRPGRAKVSVSTENTGPWVNRFTQLSADKFADESEINEKYEQPSLATITITKAFVVEGEPEQEVLRVYSANEDGFYLIIREDDQTGYYVNQAGFDEQFPRYTNLVEDLS